MDTLLERLVGLLHTFKAGEAGEEDGGDGGERKAAFGAAPALCSTSHGAVLQQAQLNAPAEKENHKADTRCAVLEAVRESAILGTADEVNRLYSE